MSENNISEAQRAARLIDMALTMLEYPSNQAQRARLVAETPQAYNQIMRARRSCALKKVNKWVAYWNKHNPHLRLALASDADAVYVNGYSLREVSAAAACGDLSALLTPKSGQ